jgi:hypothetical protein
MSSQHPKLSPLILTSTIKPPQTTVNPSIRLRSIKPRIHFPVANLASIYQNDRDIRTTNPNHSTPASNNGTQKNPTATGIDSMLGSAILTTENNHAGIQAHQEPTTNTKSTNSKNYRVSMRILKALLFLFYLLLTVYLLLFSSLVALHLRNIIERIDDSVLAWIRSLLPSVTGFVKCVAVPVFVWGEMTRYYFGV